MSIETLKDRLREYAKDLKLNLSTLASETVLDEAKRAGTFIAVTLETEAAASSAPLAIAA